MCRPAVWGLFLGLLCGVAATPLEGAQRALLVGVTRYPALSIGQQLSGPARDLELFADLLESRFGFPQSAIVKLRERSSSSRLKPTRANIVREFQVLADQTRAGDQIVIFLAGHGSQQPTRNLDDPHDPEPDGLDEVFLPSDIGAWNGEKRAIKNAIVDDEISQWLRQITQRGGAVWLIADCCHSGTLIRSDAGVVAREIPAGAFVPVQAIQDAATRARAHFSLRGTPPVSPSFGTPGGMVATYATLPGEVEPEMPMPPGDHQNPRHGLFAYAIIHVLTQSEAPLTYRELVQRIHQQYGIWNLRYPTPLVEGDLSDHVILGRESWQSRSRILLRKTSGNQLTVTAGKLHGFTPGSLLAVLPPVGTRRQQQVLGYVQVLRCRAIDSLVSSVAYDGIPAVRGFAPDCRCEVVLRSYGIPQLKVAVARLDSSGQRVSPETLQKVNASLKQLTREVQPFVIPVSEVHQADWVLQIRSQNLVLFSRSTWLLPAGHPRRGEFGQFSLQGDLTHGVSQTFLRIARAQFLLSLSTVSQQRSGARSAAVNLETLQYASEARDAPFQTVRWQNGRTLPAGTIVGFRVTNPNKTAVDVTLLFLDSKLKITAFFPTSSLITNRIPPGKSIDTARARVTPASGLETMVVLAVGAKNLRDVQDFRWLAQNNEERGGKVKIQTRLGELLRTTLFSQETQRGEKLKGGADFSVQSLFWTVD